MSKMPIEWHEQCLSNSKSPYANERNRLEHELAACIKSEKRNAFYAHQIAEAKRRKMVAFDRDRLLMPKKA